MAGAARAAAKRRDEPARDERGATDSREKDSADLSPVALTAGTPTRSVTQKEGIRTAIVSITWTFAVEWFARRLGADSWVGTDVTENGDISHFWPEDKPIWLAALARAAGIDIADVAAVGDSVGDCPMLNSVGHAAFVGADLPGEIAHAHHMSAGNLMVVVHRILAR